MDQHILLDSFEFDYLILGSGLTDSLFAACLAKTKKKVFVLDIDKSYSSSLQTLNLKELVNMITSQNPPNQPNKILTKRSIFKNFWFDCSIFSLEDFQNNLSSYDHKSYNIDLQPKLLYSTSLTVDLMKEADMDKYMEFRAVNSIFHFDNPSNKFLITPSSKGQIFVHKDLTLLEKRTLFKTLQSFINIFHWKKNIKIDPNSTAEFDKTLEIDSEFLENYEKFKSENCLKFLETLNLQKKIKDILLYTLANCEKDVEFSNDITTDELFVRMFKFVKSLGVHSNLPFLYTIYGTGDIPQAFARIAAVFGTTYIINEEVKIEKIVKNDRIFQVFCDIAGENKFFSCKNIVVGMEYQEGILEVIEEEFKEKYVKTEEFKKHYLLRMIMIVDGNFYEFEKKEGEFEDNKENNEEEENSKKLPLIYMIPPNNQHFGNKNSINLMIFGNNTYSCPKKKFLVYAKTDVEEHEVKYEEFSQKLQEFLKSYIKKGVNEWKIVFSGGYLQEKVEGLVKINEESGILLIKNNDFNIDLDNSFKEFTENIGLLIPELKENNSGYFITKNQDFEKNHDFDEEDGKGNEINKLLAKLDNIVLNKKEVEQQVEQNDEKGQKIVQNDEKDQKIELKEQNEQNEIIKKKAQETNNEPLKEQKEAEKHENQE